MLRFAAICALLFCAACQTVDPPTTASGKPEVTVTATSTDQVKSALVSRMLNRGYRITKDTQYEIDFDKPVENLVAAALLGSRYDAIPNARVSYMFATAGKDVRIVADMAVVTNPGSAFERRLDVSQGPDWKVIQAVLEGVQADVAGVAMASNHKPRTERPKQ